MKAVVYSRFPEQLNNQLREHLIEWGVDIISFGEVTPEMKKPEGAEALLSFFELMSHGQSDIAKGVAKKWGVKYIPLSRKVSSWSKYLPAPGTRPSLPEPPPSNEGRADDADEQWDDLKDIMAAEVAALKAEIAGLKAENVTLCAQYEAEIAELKQRVSAQWDSEGEALNLAAAEVEVLRGKMNELEAQVKKLEAQSIEPIIAAFRTLLASGLLTEAEVSDKLYKKVMG